MSIHIGEKTGMIVKRQKDMLVSGEKCKPLIENRVQRIAVHSIVIFFALMFVCTLLSHVSHSFTTARVSVQTPVSGTLTDRAEVEGMIRAETERNITLPEGLKVVAVSAGKGSQVKEGEALLAFDISFVEEQIKELEEEIHILELKIDISESSGSNDVITAQRDLEDAQRAYERLVERWTRSDARFVEDYGKLGENLTDAASGEERAVQEVKQELIRQAEAVVREAEINLEAVKEAAEDAIRAAEKELEDAKENLNAPDQTEEGDLGTNNRVSAYDRAAEELAFIKERWENKIQKATDALNDAKAALAAIRDRTDFSDETAVIEARSAIDAAREALFDAGRDLEDLQYQKEEDLYAARRAVEAAQTRLENARRQETVSQKEREITRIVCESELAEKEELLHLLQEILSNEGCLLSPVSGTVLDTMEKGSETEAGRETVTLSLDTEGFVFEGSLDEESTLCFSAGDKGELQYKLGGNTQKLDVEVYSISIPDENGNVLVTVVLPEGDYPACISAQLSLSEQSETYQTCLPITALRNDSGGDHVLVIRRQNSVMGTEWVAHRVDITVLDRDSQMMSVEGALTYSDQVIIGSNKGVSEGDRVRVEN